MSEEKKEYLRKQPMPKYSKGEEIFNLVSHICGGGVGVIILILSLILACLKKLDAISVISLFIYGLSAILLYTISSVYHGLHKELMSKRVFRIIDHCTIYILIAGTYTPICVIAFRGTTQGALILILEWILCAIGITLNALWLNKKPVKIISIFLYIFTGWILVFIPGAIALLDTIEFVFILIGGIMYSLGVVFYGLGKTRKWSHSVFHIFCVLGTIIQFIGIVVMILK